MGALMRRANVKVQPLHPQRMRKICNFQKKKQPAAGLLPPLLPRHEARSPRLITYDRRHYCHNHNRNKSLVMAFAKSYPALSNPAFRAEHEKATHDLSRPALGGARPGKRHLLPQRSRPLAVLDRINVGFSSHDVETSQLRMKTYLVYCCSFPIL